MANVTLNTKIILRNDTLATWNSTNPVLSKGEVAIVSDQNKLKFGNGIDSFTQLKYSGIELSDIPDATTNQRGLLSAEGFVKLTNIKVGAEVNLIEVIKVNGVAQPIKTGKIVNILVPTKTSDLTNDSNYVSDANYVHTDNNYDASAVAEVAKIANKADASTVYNKSEVDAKLVAAMRWKGSKETVGDLPATDNVTGDVWHVNADGKEYAWNGTIWEPLGWVIDLSPYATLTYLN